VRHIQGSGLSCHGDTIASKGQTLLIRNLIEKVMVRFSAYYPNKIEIERHEFVFHLENQSAKSMADWL